MLGRVAPSTEAVEHTSLIGTWEQDSACLGLPRGEDTHSSWAPTGRKRRERKSVQGIRMSSGREV